MKKTILAIGIAILFISSTIPPIVTGSKNSILFINKIEEVMNLNSYNKSEILHKDHKYLSNKSNSYNILKSEKIDALSVKVEILNESPMDSPWPMYCHDLRHTGRSPYSTNYNNGEEKWKLYIQSGIDGGIVIGEDGTIYYGYGDLYAAYPNGTIKWTYDTYATIKSAPAINEDGTVYVGIESASDKYFYAINPNGTLKWRKNLPGSVYSSSPAIGDDGTIYFGLECGYPWYGYIYALYPNGTLRWRYKTDNVVYSSPAIGDDGTIYCGSHDTYLYAFHPNNGTVKWKYKTGNWIRTSPCIADDGTIYVVSLDDYLHAVYPNGTRKWRTDVGAGTSPTIGQDGTIYCGYTNLIAVNPINGSKKWKLPIGGKIRGATPCNSVDGTIYLGNSEGSDIVAVNPDGTEKWRRSIGGDVESAPAIGEDGTIYIGDGKDDGYLHAFGPLDSNAPTAPNIDGPNRGKAETELSFTFQSTSPLERDVFYYIEWGDGKKKNWFGPFSSGEEVTANHTWSEKGTYIIKARAKDTDNLWGPWSEFEVTIPRTRTPSYHWFLERFPMLERLLGLIFNIPR